MILIITSKEDSHIAAVTRHIDAAGAEWTRLNTEDAATNLAVGISSQSGDATIGIRDSGKTLRISDVSAVWYRKPQPVDVSHLSLTGGARDYVEAEFREVLDGIYGLLRGAAWINDPFRTRLAHRKLVQLEVARKVGLATPRTLVTNDADAAIAFAVAVGGDVAIKSLGSLSVIDSSSAHTLQYGIFTRRVTVAELESVKHTIPHLATTFQEFVSKRSELRVTCVGREVLACEIIPRPDDLTADDSRFDMKHLIHKAVECSSDLKRKLWAYMDTFGLVFGAFDLVVRPSGEIVFLECNPNGQWQWVEDLTRLPIGEGIARYLLQGSRTVT